MPGWNAYDQAKICYVCSGCHDISPFTRKGPVLTSQIGDQFGSYNGHTKSHLLIDF